MENRKIEKKRDKEENKKSKEIMIVREKAENLEPYLRVFLPKKDQEIISENEDAFLSAMKKAVQIAIKQTREKIK